jgi:hypothetical protein
MARFGTNNAVLVFAAIFDNCCSWHPEPTNFYAISALVFTGMLQIEKAGGSANVIVIKMGESDHVIVVTVCIIKILAKLSR